MKAISKEEIREAFKGVDLDNIDNAMLSKCTSLVNALNIHPNVMAECWEAFSINKNVQTLTDHSWQSFSAELRKEADKESNHHHDHNTPMEQDEADGGDGRPNDGAVAVRHGMGKRQVGSPPSGLAMVTPPTKRLSTENRDTNANNRTTLSAVDAVATTAQTPMSKATAAATTTVPELPKYEERTGAGKVILTFNPNDLKPMETVSSSQPKCAISMDSFDTNVREPYRHLFTTMEERAKALDQHIVRLQEIMKERYDIGTDTEMPRGNGEEEDNASANETAIAPLEAVGVPRQEKITCIGRICNAAHEGRINLASVVLEGSRSMGGARIEVDLTHLQADKTNSFSLFPGQIVAIEGMNPTGRKLVAHRICEGAAHNPTKSTAKRLLQYHHDEQYQNGQPLKVVTVSGPYTTSNNLAFEPLFDFMGVVLSEKPDVVIMVGPFVDMRHKDIQSGKARLEFEDGDNLNVPYEAFFASKVAAILEDFFETEKAVHTQFVLVPSLDDATAEWVYPQAPFQDRVFGKPGQHLKLNGGEDVEVGSLGLHHLLETNAWNEKDGASRDYRRIHCAPNPCTLQINEIVMGITGTDAVFHMSADETNANLVPGSRLARIAQHMLQQQSYYPLFPPAMGTNLDLKQMHKWNMPCRPDVLIVPSKLTSFARTVFGETVVVNPGELSKNTTGGTFAVMEIHPIKREDLENAGNEVEMEHNIRNRLRLEVRKI